jgi:hypothetical protein
MEVGRHIGVLVGRGAGQPLLAGFVLRILDRVGVRIFMDAFEPLVDGCLLRGLLAMHPLDQLMRGLLSSEVRMVAIAEQELAASSGMGPDPPFDRHRGGFYWRDVPRIAIVKVPAKGGRMTTIRLHETTTATPEQFVAGLTDFGPGRSQLFPNSADDDLKVHDKTADQADVTEGSRGIWETLHYDWSDPKRVVLTTTDSNTWANTSTHTYSLTPRPDGNTDIDLVVVRHGKNLKGHTLAAAFTVIGKSLLGKAFSTTVKAIEARNYGATPTDTA